MAKRALQFLVFLLLMLGSLFGSAGRLDWTAAWLLAALSVAAGIAASLLLRKYPDLIQERARGFKGSPLWDKLIGSVLALFGPVATWVTAGLDQRYGWSPPPKLWVQAAAFVLALAGYALIAWAMSSNRFFSAAVRIQKDRGHHVVTAGPYARVRHPGYIGMVAGNLATPAILGSTWAFLPAAITALAIGVRTALEDRLLRAQLEGYEEYAARVRFRLLPGVW